MVDSGKRSTKRKEKERRNRARAKENRNRNRAESGGEDQGVVKAYDPVTDRPPSTPFL